VAEHLVAAVTEHCALFNSCVRSGDWDPFVATFTEDATLRLINVPAEPVGGRAGIAKVYATAAPTQTMTLEEVEPTDDRTVAVRFVWESGDPGEMVVTWRGDQVAAVRTTIPPRRPVRS
jgi:hypothetical protein